MSLLYRALLLLVAGLAFFFLAGVFAVWAPDKPLAELQPRWASAPSQFMTVAGLPVHLRDEGPRDDPVPIVLLHGMADSLHTWDGWVAQLNTQRRVIRLDLPGFGLTGPPVPDDYSTTADLSLVAALLDRLNLSRVVLAGHSLGGQIAWQVAAAMPERVDRLILVDAAGYPSAAAQWPPGLQVALWPGAGVMSNYLLPRGLVQASLQHLYGDPSLVTPALVDRYYDMALRSGNRQALVRRLDAMAQHDGSTRIGSLALPTLVLWGARDPWIPVESGRRFAQDIAGARLVVFDGLGHFPHQEDPVRTVSEVRQFLGLVPQR